jgi:hypothetical protein
MSRKVLIVAMAAALLSAACGGSSGSDDPADATTANSVDTASSDDTAAETTNAATSGEAGSVMVDDPTGDLVDGEGPCEVEPGTFDVVSAWLAPADDGFVLYLEAVGDPLSVDVGATPHFTIVLTTPTGDYYDIRAWTAEGFFSTFDGGGPYAWDLGAQVTHTITSDNTIEVEVSKLVPQPGWTMELTSESGRCSDVVETVTLG